MMLKKIKFTYKHLLLMPTLFIPPPRKQSLGEYIGITLSIRPCTLQAQLLLNDVLDFYETLHICSMVAVQNLKGEIIQLKLYEKGGAACTL
jgi:hypothetical protein